MHDKPKDAPRRARAGVLSRIAPTRRVLHHALAPAVAIGLGGLLLASGWESLRPATPVQVVPVVFAGATGTQPNDLAGQPAQTGQPDQPASSSGRAAQAAGWLEADPYLIACTALADGIVAEIAALEGDRVEAGQVVARLIDDDARLALQRAEAQVTLADAGVLAARADLAAAEGDWEHPIERDRLVATSNAQLRETEAELAQLPVLVAAERATLDRLGDELARLQEAAASGAVSSIELMIAARQNQAQAASVEALEARGPILTARRDRLAAEVAAATQSAKLRITERRALDTARAKLTSAQAQLARDQAARDEAVLRLDRMTIRAPISGFVQRRLKAPGDKAMLGMDDPQSAQLLHLYDPERLQVRVDVPLADAAGIVVGQQCEVLVEVLPDRHFEGQVSRITHEADLQKNTLQVKVQLRDPSPILKPEMLARVKFLAGAAAPRADSGVSKSFVRPPAGRMLRVPEAALHASDAGSVVWVVRDRRAGRGRARPVALELGARANGWVEASGALQPGDLLVMGDAILTPGQRVRIRRTEGGAG